MEAAFDVDLRARQIHFRVDDVDFPTAARLLGDMTGTFWSPLTSRLFFIAENTSQKRKDYEPSVLRTVLLARFRNFRADDGNLRAWCAK